MNNKIRVLAIAPYEEMKNQLENSAALFPSIELTVFVGDLEKGAQIAKSNFHENYDAVLSRGGTAKLIQRTVPLPVVEIGISLYDILCTFKLAQTALKTGNKNNNRVAVVGFSEITKNAHLLSQVLDFDLEIYTIEEVELVLPILQRLQQDGCTMLLCDMVANTSAQKLGLNTFLINSGSESIRTALEEILRIIKCHDTLREENQFLRKILMNQGTNTVVYDSAGSLFFSTLPSEKGTDDVLQLLLLEIEHTGDNERRKILRNKKGTLYTIYAQRFATNMNIYVAFFFTARQAPMMVSRCGIQFFARQDVENEFYDSLYSVSGTARELQSTLGNIELGNIPLMMDGEIGSGREQAMYGLYLHSSLRDRPLVNINCSLLNDRTWDFLMNNPNSPLSDSGNMLFFKNVDVLSTTMAHELIASIQVMEVCKRNAVIFSCTRTATAGITHIGQEIIRQLQCLEISLPTLRDRADSIPALISLCLNRLNQTLNSQVAGIALEGLQLLQDYPWQHNYTQFKRLLGELMILAKEPIISVEEVRSVLAKEKNLIAISLRAEDSSIPLDLTRPLAEIERDIAHRVLIDSGNNQTAAAKRLGISRTTMWRITHG